MFQKIIVASLTIGVLLTTNMAMACPAGQTPCGTNGCCECDVSFTTESEDVTCQIHINNISVIECSVSEFINIAGYSDVTVEFNEIPSSPELDTALTAECGNHTKCAEKFQCQKHGGCPVGHYQCGSELCCPV